MGFPGGIDSKKSFCNAGDLGLISGSGRSFGEGNGYPLQYSCLENSMDRRAYQASPWGCKLVDTTEQIWLSVISGSMVKEIKTIKGSIQLRNNSYFVLLTDLKFPKLHSNSDYDSCFTKEFRTVEAIHIPRFMQKPSL